MPYFVASTVSHPRASTRRAGVQSAPIPWQWWWLLVPVLGVASTVFILVSHSKPGFDAYGWMAWGRQVLHWNLNTDGAPSWKPLTFLFTLPYALTGHRLQLWLWTLTATVAGFAAAAFAARIAFRLTPVAPGRAWARFVTAAFAAVGVLAISGYAHLVVITNSDPLILAVLLAAIDCHLSGRHRIAFGLIWLGALGRPEVWAFVFGYAVWSWRAVPAMRWVTVVGLVLVPVAWFLVPGLTSKSVFSAGDLALGQATVIHGNKFVGVFNRLRGLTGVPMQIAMVGAMALAAGRRLTPVLWLAGLAILWGLIEIIFALHGWSAVPRYLIEPGAVLIVVAATGVGHLIADPPSGHAAWRYVGPAAALVLAVAMIPYIHDTLQTEHGLRGPSRQAETRLNRLSQLVAAEGGARAIRSCGQPISDLAYQSLLAWELDMNVGSVGFKPGKAIRSGKPIVFFKPHGEGWSVHATHTAPANAARCALLDRSTAFN